MFLLRSPTYFRCRYELSCSGIGADGFDKYMWCEVKDPRKMNRRALCDVTVRICVKNARLLLTIGRMQIPMPQAMKTALFTDLDWLELAWGIDGVAVRGQHFDLRCVRSTPVRPYPLSKLLSAVRDKLGVLKSTSDSSDPMHVMQDVASVTDMQSKRRCSASRTTRAKRTRRR